MDSIFNLEAYLTAGVENIVSGIIKAALRNPAESLFMAQYALYSSISAKLRNKAEKEGQHIPPFLIASITTQCNLHCAGCYDRANRDRCACGEDSGKKPLDAVKWADIFRQSAELGVSFVLLAGGEPFLRRDVLEAAGSQPKLLFPVFTNGTLIDKTRLDLLERRRNLIPIISVEGGRDATDARRGEGVYDLLRGTMRELDSRGLLFGASVTITRDNLSEVMGKEFINELSGLGCKAIIYVEYVPADGKSDELAPDDETRVIMENLLQEARITCPDMLLISFPGDEKAAGGCLAAGRGFFHINAYGGAEPCPFSPYSDVNLTEVSVAEALNSPLFVKLRDSGGLMVDHTGGCALFARDDEVKKIINGY
jgi:Predicted Fe-S oxidoreductases